VKLNLPQRIVIVVALGLVLGVFGEWITLRGATSFGWVAYAPLSTSTSHRNGLTFGWITLVWIGLTVLWAALSVAVLRSPKSE
jgi:heme/copper-type cytochrome/quinol oxidase subunit 1